MHKTAHVIFELNTDCNLSSKHAACPINIQDRYSNLPRNRKLSDDKVLEVSRAMYLDFGFKGYIGFHNYNEPMLAIARIIALIKRIRLDVPQAKFILWTNGTLIAKDAKCLELSEFDKIVISCYNKGKFEHVKAVCPDVVLLENPTLDARAEEKRCFGTVSCWRGHNDFIIDNYGNVHLCCIDFRGQIKIGNVFSKKLQLLVERYQEVRAAAYGDAKTMLETADEFCKNCTERHQFTLGYL